MKKLLVLWLLFAFGYSAYQPLSTLAQDGESVGSQLARQPISVNNVRQIRELATLGYGEILDFDWSPDGELLAVATSTGIWSFSDFTEPPRQLALAETRVTSIDFSPDGTQLAATANDINTDVVSIIDLYTGNISNTFDVRTGTEQIAYHPTLPILIIGALDEVRIFQLDGGTSIRLDKWSAPPFAISNGGEILVAYGRSSLNVWNIDEILHGTEAEPRVIELPEDKQFTDKLLFLPDDNLLLKHFDLVDIGTGEFVDELNVRRSSARIVTISPDGQWVIAPNQSQFSVLDAMSLRLLFDVNVDLAEPLSVKLHPENNQFAAHTSRGMVVGQLDRDTAHRLVLPLMEIMPHEIVISPDLSRLIISERNGDILVWDMQARDVVQTILTDSNTVWRMSISTDGRWLAGLSRILQENNSWLVRPIIVNLETYEQQILGFDGALQVEFDKHKPESVYVVDPDGLQLVDFVAHDSETVISVGQPPRGASEEIGRLLSPDQSLFLANRSVWDVGSRQVLWTFDISLATRLGTTSWYEALEFSPDSSKLMILVGFSTQFLYLWDMQNGDGIISQRLRLDTCDIAFSPVDARVAIVGQIWASGGSGDVSIWNYEEDPIWALRTSTVISCIPALFTADGSLVIRELEISLEGVVTGLNFWNPDTRQLHHRIWVYGDTYLASTILSQDNSLLAVATYSGVIRVYGMPLNSECYLTTALSVNRRERPTIQSRIVGNLNVADIEFPSEIWIDAEGVNWWHLEDGSWVNGAFVDVSEGCNSIPIAPSEP